MGDMLKAVPTTAFGRTPFITPIGHALGQAHNVGRTQVSVEIGTAWRMITEQVAERGEDPAH